MVQVRLEIRTGTARFRVSVRAQSTQRAVSLADARYPGGEARVLRPAEPELADFAVATRAGRRTIREVAA
jgi:hypothetical protein